MPKWEEIRDDLFEAVMMVQAPLNKEQQEDIVRIMRGRGHNMVWNAIRYEAVVSIFSCLFSLFSFLPSPPSFHKRHFQFALQILIPSTSPTHLPLCLKRVSNTGHLQVAKMAAGKQHTWTADTYKDVVVALNNLFSPNAADCRAMIGELQAKGWAYSDNALL